MPPPLSERISSSQLFGARVTVSAKRRAAIFVSRYGRWQRKKKKRPDPPTCPPAPNAMTRSAPPRPDRPSAHRTAPPGHSLHRSGTHRHATTVPSRRYRVLTSWPNNVKKKYICVYTATRLRDATQFTRRTSIFTAQPKFVFNERGNGTRTEHRKKKSFKILNGKCRLYERQKAVMYFHSVRLLTIFGSIVATLSLLA